MGTVRPDLLWLLWGGKKRNPGTLREELFDYKQTGGAQCLVRRFVPLYQEREREQHSAGLQGYECLQCRAKVSPEEHRGQKVLGTCSQAVRAPGCAPETGKQVAALSQLLRSWCCQRGRVEPGRRQFLVMSGWKRKPHT